MYNFFRVADQATILVLNKLVDVMGNVTADRIDLKEPVAQNIRLMVATGNLPLLALYLLRVEPTFANGIVNGLTNTEIQALLILRDDLKSWQDDTAIEFTTVSEQATVSESPATEIITPSFFDSRFGQYLLKLSFIAKLARYLQKAPQVKQIASQASERDTTGETNQKLMLSSIDILTIRATADALITTGIVADKLENKTGTLTLDNHLPLILYLLWNHQQKIKIVTGLMTESDMKELKRLLVEEIPVGSRALEIDTIMKDLTERPNTFNDRNVILSRLVASSDQTIVAIERQPSTGNAQDFQPYTVIFMDEDIDPADQATRLASQGETTAGRPAKVEVVRGTGPRPKSS